MLGVQGLEVLRHSGQQGHQAAAHSTCKNLSCAYSDSLWGRPKFQWTPLPMKVGKSEKHVAHPALLPHMYFESLHANREDLWRDSVVSSDPDGCLSFWDEMKDTAIVREHPHLERREWSRMVPLGLHGDGGAFYKHESMFVFTWNSLIGTGNTRAKRFVIPSFANLKWCQEPLTDFSKSLHGPSMRCCLELLQRLIGSGDQSKGAGDGSHRGGRGRSSK